MALTRGAGGVATHVPREAMDARPTSIGRVLPNCAVRVVDGAGGDVPPGAFRGVTLAVNVESPQVVDAALATAECAGARIAKAPGATEWGGYHGYFADPDGHLWEVAHNPFWPLDDSGVPQLPA